MAGLYKDGYEPPGSLKYNWIVSIVPAFLQKLIVMRTKPTVCQGDGLALLALKCFVNPGDPVIIILATGSEVRGFKPGRGRWIFSERKNPEYDFLRKGRNAVDPVS